MTKSNKKSSGSIFWVRDRKTKITVFRKDGQMKVRKGNSIDEAPLSFDPGKDSFTNGMGKQLAKSRAASICSVCNSSLSIHQNEQSCKGGK